MPYPYKVLLYSSCGNARPDFGTRGRGKKFLNTKRYYIPNVKEIKGTKDLVTALKKCTNACHIDNGSFTEQLFKFTQWERG